MIRNSVINAKLWVDGDGNQSFGETPVPEVDYKYQKIDGGLIIEMSQAEKDVVDAVELASYKVLKNSAIDDKTSEFISVGFVFQDDFAPDPDHVGIYSLSAEAQINITNIPIIKDDPAVYPIQFNRKDDSGIASLADATEAMQFYGTAMITKKTHLESGVTLKMQVNAATDTDGVDAVIDNR